MKRREFLQIVGGALFGAVATACGSSMPDWMKSTPTSVKTPEKTSPVEANLIATTIDRPDPPTKEWLNWDSDTGKLAISQLAVKVNDASLPLVEEIGFRLIETRDIRGTTSFGYVSFVNQLGEMAPATIFQRVVRYDKDAGENVESWEAQDKEKTGFFQFMKFGLGNSPISSNPQVAEKEVESIIKSRASQGKLSYEIINIYQGRSREFTGVKDNMWSDLLATLKLSGGVLAQGPVATATAEATATNKPSPTSAPTLEPSPTPEPTNVPKPEGMDKLGAEMVAQMVYSGEPRNRWEYKGVAYWDEKKGRLELDPSTTSLDFADNKDLFVKLDAATVEEMVVVSGYTAIPIPLDVDSGVMYQERGGKLFSVVFQGVEGAAIVAPFGGSVVKVGETVWGVDYEKLAFYLKGENGVELWIYTRYEGNLPSETAAGQVITIVGREKLPYTEKYASESVLQIGFDNTTLASLLTDELGRIVMIKN